MREVREGGERNEVTDRGAPKGEPLSERVELPLNVLNQALDPVAFVEGRAVLGGAAASATKDLLDAQHNQLDSDLKWHLLKNGELAEAKKRLKKAITLLK